MRAARHEVAARYGIADIGVHIPARRVPTTPLAPALGVPTETLQRRIGFESLARKADGDETSDLAFNAVQDLLRRHPLDPADIGCLVVVTQNPDGTGIPQVSALLHGRLGWPTNIPAFDLALGCSGYVYGLAVVSSFLAMQNGKAGILVTADPYSKIVDPGDRATALLFGDGASATLIERNGPWRLGNFDFGTAGTHAQLLHTDARRRLRMDGQAVARFCLREIPRSIERTLVRNGLTVADVDRFVLHQGSRCIVEDIAKAIGAEAKTPFVAQRLGNTASSSVPIALRDMVGETNGAQTVLLSTFGIGMSWATVVIEKDER
ncbi:ketoacyl-ACP synthase III [Rudaea sp.]|uniref:ketoacyl-ACP synthase III n=1 Tax=Rudaea sp. TaxID=2136325 RepID=UPI00322008A6